MCACVGVCTVVFMYACMHVLYDSVHVVLESSIVLFSLANPLYLLTSFPPPQYVSNCGARIVLYHKVFDKNIKQY